MAKRRTGTVSFNIPPESAVTGSAMTASERNKADQKALAEENGQGASN